MSLQFTLQDVEWMEDLFKVICPSTEARRLSDGLREVWGLAIRADERSRMYSAERDAIHEDMVKLGEALGEYTGARPESPQVVFRELVEKVRALT